ncbi:hypothetical protein ACHQM5_017151 [Ranunculus cassubicifolius]
MASSFQYGLILIITFFAIGANARPGVHFHPCKTLFISSFTITSSNLQQNPNPNSNLNQNSPRFFTIFDFYPTQQPLEIFIERRTTFDSNNFLLPRSNPIRFEKPETPKSILPYDSFGFSSLRERTKDIFSVVAALLFGVGCGALTSATMYLAWSLITNRYDARGDDVDVDFSDEDDEVFSPKKMGYCNIPDDVTAPDAKDVVPAKEVV